MRKGKKEVRREEREEREKGRRGRKRTIGKDGGVWREKRCVLQLIKSANEIGTELELGMNCSTILSRDSRTSLIPRLKRPGNEASGAFVPI